jgi:hypothetical protein
VASSPSPCLAGRPVCSAFGAWLTERLECTRRRVRPGSRSWGVVRSLAERRTAERSRNPTHGDHAEPQRADLEAHVGSETQWLRPASGGVPSTGGPRCRRAESAAVGAAARALDSNRSRLPNPPIVLDLRLHWTAHAEARSVWRRRGSSGTGPFRWTVKGACPHCLSAMDSERILEPLPSCDSTLADISACGISHRTFATSTTLRGRDDLKAAADGEGRAADRGHSRDHARALSLRASACLS